MCNGCQKFKRCGLQHALYSAQDADVNYQNLLVSSRVREKSQYCVTEVFDYLSNSLGITTFKKLFPLILTDNGTEFQFPARIECDEMGEIRTKVFFCNPNCSWQKGMIEKNHEYIRYVIPKGQSLDLYSWEE